jgi:hypothetical protein
MAKLTAKTRKAIPTSKFAGPGRSYPVQDRKHAALAKGYATKEVAKGNLSRAVEKRIDAKANRVLGAKRKAK